MSERVSKLAEIWQRIVDLDLLSYIPMAKPPAFADVEYWDRRFKQNKEPFDWLQQPPVLDEAISAALTSTSALSPRILHVGCGTSLLSFHLRKHVRDPRRIHNIDFSSEAVEWGQRREREMFGFEMDNDDDEGGAKSSSIHKQVASQLEMPMSQWSQTSLLSLKSIIATCTLGGYQVIVDKSLCDAIACGSDVEVTLPYFLYMNNHSGAVLENFHTDFTLGTKHSIHPLHVLAVHLALVADSPGAQWLALSYSEQRFPFFHAANDTSKSNAGEPDFSIPPEVLLSGFPDPARLWTMVRRIPIGSSYGGTIEKEGVHTPATFHWLYVLERTSIELKVRGT